MSSWFWYILKFLFIQILNSVQLCTATNARIQMVIHQWVDFKGIQKTSWLQEWTYCAWEAPCSARNWGTKSSNTWNIRNPLGHRFQWTSMNINEHQWTWMITYGVAIPNQANQAVGIVGAIPTCYLWEYWCPNLDSTVVSFKAFTMRLCAIWVMATWSWKFHHLRLKKKRLSWSVGWISDPGLFNWVSTLKARTSPFVRLFRLKSK